MCSWVKLLMRPIAVRTPAIALANGVAEQPRDDQDDGQHAEGQQRQPPVDAQHHNTHDREREEVVDDGKNAAREHLVDRVNVGSQARNEPADRMRIEEPHMQPLHMAEDVAAQVEHDLLPDPLHEVDLDKLERVRQAERREVEPCKLRDALPGVGRETAREPRSCDAGFAAHVTIDANLDEEWPDHIAERLERDRDRRDECLHPVGLDVRAEPADQLRVVDLANGIIVFARSRLRFRCGGGSFVGRRLVRVVPGVVRHRARGHPSLLYEATRRAAGSERRRLLLLLHLLCLIGRNRRAGLLRAFDEHGPVLGDGELAIEGGEGRVASTCTAT